MQNTPNPVPAASPATAAPTIIIQQKSGLFGKFLAVVGWLGFFAMSLAVIVLLIVQAANYADYYDTSHGISERYHSGNETGPVKVAIVDVSGVIVDGEGFAKWQIDRVKEDDDIKAVVVRVDSPGGTITGSDYIYHHLKKLREERKIPVVVSMGSIAASGGYYVSMAVGDQAKSIYAEPTTTTGSIGVIIPHYDLSGLMERFDVRDDSIVSHPRKQMLAMTRPIPEEHREILQVYVNEAFERFKKIVKTGRPALAKNEEKLAEVATGEVFTAEKAKEHGLVDEIGFLDDAIARAIEVGGLNKDDVRVVEYERPTALLSIFEEAQARASHDRSDLASMLELATPRAYYLFTSLPPLVQGGIKLPLSPR